MADNKNGGIYAKLQYEQGSARLTQENYIHGNAIEYNGGGTLQLQGTKGQLSNVKVTRNYFAVNIAKDGQGRVHTVCNMTDLAAHFQGNIFFNNSGQYIVEFDASQGKLSLLNNTLYRNRGMGVNYGVTVLLNGAAEVHNNVFENLKNLFQISTTLQGNPVTVDATYNWWGVSVLSLIESFIKDKRKDYRLSLAVVFKPFWILPPQKVFTGKY